MPQSLLINKSILTRLLTYDGGLDWKHVANKEVKMAEDDERRRGGWAAVVLLDQLVSLKLPNSVCVVLNGLERKAVEGDKEDDEYTRLQSGITVQKKAPIVI